MTKKYQINDWLHDLETRNVQEIQLGLTRIKEVAQILDVQLLGCPVITVAGTNGKGSTVTALEAIYHSAGYNVGAFTSPHLILFNERIRVNLIPISNEALCEAFHVIDHARKKIILTYFEITTLAALWYFKKMKLDIVILEVGLGGRLDATNIVDADLSVITTIDYDHQEFLGDTLEAIGYEKAGILRSKKPFIYADKKPPLTIIETAIQLDSPTYLYDQDYFIDEKDSSWSIHYEKTHDFDPIYDLPKPLIQLKSAAAAITAARLLRDYLPIDSSHFQSAMSQIFVPGRLQLQTGTVSVLYDVSHNPQSTRLLAETLQKIKKGKVRAVFSALKDKDIFNLIMPLKDCVDSWYPAQLNNKRAASADLLITIFRDAAISVDICYTSPLTAFETALKESGPGDLIVVYGSFFTVSHVMANWRFNETNN